MASRILLLLAVVLPLICANPAAAGTAAGEPPMNIVQLGESNKEFTILMHYVREADLVKKLSDERASLTVFAPSNSAFRKLAFDFGFVGNFKDEDAVIAFLTKTMAADAQESNFTIKQVLQAYLSYHIVEGVITSKKLLQKTELRTLFNGAVIRRKRSMPLVLIDKAPAMRNPMLVKEGLDIKASNGIVHVINRVLLADDVKPTRRRRFRRRHVHRRRGSGYW